MIGLAWLASLCRDARARAVTRGPAIAVLLLTALAVAGLYAVVKGEISEKLALRYAVLLGPRHQE